MAEYWERDPMEPRVEEDDDYDDGRQMIQAMRPKQLRALWADVAAEGLELPAIAFYGHSKGPWRCFSNFHEHEPFDFEIPERCGRAMLVASGRSATVACAFAEKAIMAAKAATMSDFASYDAIVRAASPSRCKKLGRQVGPWDQRKWDAVVCEIAVEAVAQKFGQLPHLWATLESTGNRLICESTKNDSIWGTGLDATHADAHRPARWRGTNILGYALVVARARLRAVHAEY